MGFNSLTSKENNQLALFSLIAGAAAWTFFPGVGAVAAIILGHMALSEIRKSGEKGEGLAKIGLILGYGQILLSCCTIGVYLTFFGALFGAAAVGSTGG